MSAPWRTWERCESGPVDATHTVLLLPGGMCRARSYEEVMTEPSLAGVRLVAVTMPGHGGTPPPEDFTLEHYARLTSELAADVGADAVVGFSMGANIALEMVASGAFSGPVVLLAPSFSLEDEAMFLRVLNQLAKVLGRLPFAAMLKLVGLAVKDSPVPPERLAVLVEDLRRNDPRAMRQGMRAYLRYLARYGSVAPRLVDAGVPAWVVHGETGDGGVTDAERATLEVSPEIEVITLPGQAFFVPNEQPALVADLTLKALAAAASIPAPESPGRPD
jgi:pimeloyl-ACP methyl ester carboxylesterase